MLQFQPMKLLVTQQEAAAMLNMCGPKFWEEVHAGENPQDQNSAAPCGYDVRDLLAYVDRLKEEKAMRMTMLGLVIVDLRPRLPTPPPQSRFYNPLPTRGPVGPQAPRPRGRRLGERNPIMASHSCHLPTARR